MNLKEVKNLNDVYKVGDIWYQRSFKLRDIWQNPDESIIRQTKAFTLWLVLQKRIIKVTELVSKLNQIKPKYELGGH
jgi:hypothetical protein